MNKVNFCIKLITEFPNIGEVRVLLSFAHFIGINPEKRCSIKRQYIADLMQVSATTVRSGLDYCIDRGLVLSLKGNPKEYVLTEKGVERLKQMLNQ